MMPLSLEVTLANVICEALKAADPDGYVGPAVAPDTTIDGHFDMRAVSRHVLLKLAALKFGIHCIKNVEDGISR
jgi:hypothetical protein